MVSSLYEPQVSWSLIQGYLVAGALHGLPVALIFTKSDLLGQSAAAKSSAYEAEVRERQQYLSNLGWPIWQFDARNPPEHSNELWYRKTSLLSGLSGAGKSTLVNSWGGEMIQTVGESSAKFGRHTTSATRLISLAAGQGWLMDSPGIRSLEPVPQRHEDYILGFPDLSPYIGQCAQRDCQHLSEPGCAVISAVEQGDLPKWRVNAYTYLCEHARHQLRPY